MPLIQDPSFGVAPDAQSEYPREEESLVPEGSFDSIGTAILMGGPWEDPYLNAIPAPDFVFEETPPGSPRNNNNNQVQEDISESSGPEEIQIWNPYTNSFMANISARRVATRPPVQQAPQNNAS